MARVLLKNINKIYEGTVPVKKAWYEFWKSGRQPREVHVVRDVSLEIKDGEFMVLVGPSGCGKSTTLRMVAGLEDITSGEMYIGDTLVNQVEPKDRDIAMVFQNYALYPHMDVYENMAFGLRQRKMPEAEIEGLVRKAADLLKIDSYLHRKPGELSGGQRQRVAMGRAIVRRPKVYLMDEPLSNLDAKLRVQMRAELQKLHHALGVTTIYVTHDQTEAMTLGHRIVLMKDGIIQQLDTPLAIYQTPANLFVAGFIGSPPMNFISANVAEGHDGLVLRAGAFDIPLPPKSGVEACKGRPVTLGIRPEDVHDASLDGEGAPGVRLEARVEVFEAMGSEVYLYLGIGGDTLVARVDSKTAARVDDTLRVRIDLARIHVFDPQTEVAIAHGVAGPAPAGVA